MIIHRSWQSAVEKVKVASSQLASGHDRARQNTIGQSLAVEGLKIMTDCLECTGQQNRKFTEQMTRQGRIKMEVNYASE